VETACLRAILSDERVKVIALGGGAWIVDENRQLIAQAHGLTVWLDADFELCWQRIQAGTVSRPLASSRAVAAELYNQRLAHYSTTAIRVEVGHSTTPAETARKIIETILLNR
jgi:shikimate kinase